MAILWCLNIRSSTVPSAEEVGNAIARLGPRCTCQIWGLPKTGGLKIDPKYIMSLVVGTTKIGPFIVGNSQLSSLQSKEARSFEARGARQVGYWAGTCFGSRCTIYAIISLSLSAKLMTVAVSYLYPL